MADDVQVPNLTQYTHHIKLEETAQGVRASVSVFANDRVKALEEAIGTYEVLISELDAEEILRAPMEIKNKK